jgi:uroporphyrinogen decarboxylase
MKPFHPKMIDREYYRSNRRQPDFDNLLAVLRRQAPKRWTLFEYFMNDNLARDIISDYSGKSWIEQQIAMFTNAGYDYVTISDSFGFSFPNKRSSMDGSSTISINRGFMFTDRESFEAYEWIEPEDCDYSALDEYAQKMPKGMKAMINGPGGVLENAIALAGYENLCYMIVDDPELAHEVFAAVGGRLARYYDIAAAHPAVGAVMCNDDWGFKTQTMLSPGQMREYVFEWHKKVSDIGHKHGKPVILHSCGALFDVYEDITGWLGFDGKHSYEDVIEPVEMAYERLHGSIAVLGGMDMDFVCRSTPDEVYSRACAMLERTRGKGGYALGTGNSVPAYVPLANYYAMIAAANFNEE